MPQDTHQIREQSATRMHAGPAVSDLQEVSYLDSPLYRAALRHLQRGEWEAGLVEMEWLARRHPLDHELRAMYQGMQLRARIDQDERADQEHARRQRLVTLGIRLSSLVLIIALAVLAMRFYSVMIQQQWSRARQNLDNEIQVINLAVKFRDAQALIRAGQPAAARALLAEITATDPDYPGVSQALAEADSVATLDIQYAEAMGLIQQGDLPAALAILESIAAEEPYYKDVGLRIADIQQQARFDDMLAQADEAFKAGDWTAAISEYEAIHALDPGYQPELVEEGLFRSYVHAAQAALVDQADSLGALQIAEGYFRKALALRPQDPEIGVERELARLFLKAQADFSNTRWSQVIADMEFVYGQDPEYALGTARQTLYEAYVARGESWMGAEDFQAALRDYQRAAELAQQDPDALLRLYEAQVNVAEAQGSLGNFQLAVQLYREALLLGGIGARAEQNQPSLAAAIEEAEQFSGLGDYAKAFERYTEALRGADPGYESIIHVVQPGEYLTLLASRYGSTIQAIVAANKIANPNKIFTNQQLEIPLLP